MLPTARYWLALVVLVSLLGSGWIAASRPPEGLPADRTAPRAGFTAPDFTVEVLDGDSVALAEYRGKGVILNFWATWCLPCRREMPALQRVAEAYEADGLVVLLVNQGESAGAIRTFTESLGLTMPVLLDPGGAVGESYRVSAMPSTYFILPDGKILDVTVGGPMSEAYLRSYARALVESVTP